MRSLQLTATEIPPRPRAELTFAAALQTLQRFAATAVRCHLMIGAASSGRTTAARFVADAIQRRDGLVPVYISSSEIRWELYGSHQVDSPWAAIEAHIHERLWIALQAGRPVVLDATYTRREYRLAITQALDLPLPVQWVGWWLDTPRHLCLQWNRQRQQPVAESIIQEHCAQLLQTTGAPQRREGFAAVVRLAIRHRSDLGAYINSAYDQLEARIQAGALRERGYALHGYSRLLDLERLLYLIALLSRYPQLTATGAARDPELLQLLSPLPAGGSAQLAAALLETLHGRCYGDPLAVAADLEWLDQQGFSSRSSHHCAEGSPPLPPVQPPPWPAGRPRPLGGLPALAERQRFSRTFSLLRHLIHHPGDRQPGMRIDAHLAATLNHQYPDAEPWRPREVHELITATLTPYGFRLPGGSGKPGYTLGLALLSRQQLLEVHRLLERQSCHHSDPEAEGLSRELRARLNSCGIELPGLGSNACSERQCQRRALHSQLEEAIAAHQRLQLCRFDLDPGQPVEVCGWPLQVLHHRERWWLLLEHDHIGHACGLLAAIPIAQLRWQGIRDSRGRDPQRHGQALRWAERLRQFCAGLELGPDLTAQQALLQARAAERRALLQTLKLRCTAAVMAEIQQELGRFHPACVRLAPPLPGDPWWPSTSPWCCLRAELGASHPYPLELDLPPWVITGAKDLRRWLFAWGAGLRIEAPALVEAERQRWLAAHQLPGTDPSGTSVQIKTMGRDTAEAERKQQRICKRIGPQRLNSSRYQ
jgi:predicted kinase